LNIWKGAPFHSARARKDKTTRYGRPI